MNHCHSRLIMPAMMAILSSLLVGCATRTAVLTGYTKPASPPTFRLIDKRPAGERTTHWLSLFILSCDYGVRQFGDSATVPGRIALLEQDLDSALGKELVGRTLVLTHYVIDVNSSAGLRNNTYGANPGIISGLMKGIGTRCSRKQMDGGWYSLDEITTPYPPVVVDIGLNVGGWHYRAHAVQSSAKPVGLAPFPDSPGIRSAIFGAISKATGQLIAELRANPPGNVRSASRIAGN